MKKTVSSFHRAIIGVLLCLSLNGFAPFAFAQSADNGGIETIAVSSDIKTKALSLARRIEQDNYLKPRVQSSDMTALSSVENKAKIRLARQHVMDAAFLRSEVSLKTALQSYRDLAYKLKDRRELKLAELFALFDSFFDLEASEDARQGIIERIEAYQDDPNWFVANRALLFSAIAHGINGDFDVGLRNAQTGLGLIPLEDSADKFEAQYETFDVISYLQLVMNNLESGIQTAEDAIETGKLQNRHIEGVSIINNMIFAFNNWFEFETSEKLAELLYNNSAVENGEVNPFAAYRFVQAQNNAGHYKEAYARLKNIVPPDDDIRLQIGLELSRAVSLAGQGIGNEAERSLERAATISQDGDIPMAEYEQTILQAKALIAENRGDAKTVAALLNQRLKSIVQYHLHHQSTGIQGLQAHLSNDKQRQAEREAALRREKDLAEAELAARNRAYRFLMVIAALMFVSAIAATAFAVWRQRVNKILALAAREARSAERAKSQFLSVMSHELRTPLNGIIGIADLLSQTGETEQIRNQTNIILKSGQNLHALLGGILDMAQIEADKLSIITVPADIRHIADMLHSRYLEQVDQSQVAFTCYIANDVPDSLMLDSLRVKQALDHMISNACKFTKTGRIHVHITCSEAAKNGDRELSVIVADTGRGITDEVQEKLFKPFVQADSTLTRDQGGAGIGLSITRGLARLMGGDVTLTTAYGRGSEFTMTLKTCAEEDARIDAETGAPVYDIVASDQRLIDFTPAMSLEKLQDRDRAKSEAAAKAEAEKARIEAERIRRAAEASEIEKANERHIKSVMAAEALSGNQPLAEQAEPATPATPAKPAKSASGAPLSAAMPTPPPAADTDIFDLEDILDDGMMEDVLEPVMDDIPQPAPAGPAGADRLTAAQLIAPEPETGYSDGPAQTADIDHNPRAGFSRRTPREGMTENTDTLEGLNILIVEDIAANQEVLRSLLEPAGCTVSSAYDGAEALDMLKAQSFDAILMDIRMPVMNGVEATKKIRATPGPHQNIAIVALTADASGENNAQCLAAGADVFLTKPVIVSELFSSIRFARRKKQRTAQNILSA